MLIALGVVILGYIGMHLSVFGRHTLAIGSSEEAARRVGLNVQRHLLKVYIVGGLASGFAGFLSLAYFTTTSVGGHTTDNLQAITAVALGGTQPLRRRGHDHRHRHRRVDPGRAPERLHHHPGQARTGR